jgi:TolC family type I secretion outer membrane protein
MSRCERFQYLVIWQKTHELVIDVYKMTKRFSGEEKFGLISQMSTFFRLSWNKFFCSTCIFLMAFLVLTIPLKLYAEEIIKKGELLTLERCIEIALKRQPGIIAATNTIRVNQSKVGKANANYYPQIDLTAGYSKVSGTSSLSTSSNSRYDQYTGSATLEQNIYDFGKTSTQVDIQNLNLDSSKSDLQNVTSQVIFKVRQAYFGVLQAKKKVGVAEEAIKQFRQHLDQAKGFYEVGTKPKFDVTKAEVDLSNSILNLIKASNVLSAAIATLNNAIGLPDAPEYLIEDNLSFEKHEITFEEAIEKAYKNRSDLSSIVFKRQAAEKSIELAKTGYYPALTGNATYRRSGEKFPLGEGWDAGVVLSFPIFDGFLTKYQVEEAKANLDVLKANEELLRQNIFLEVQQAYLKIKEAEESIPAAELVVKQAEENLELANGRYAAGVGNPIEVTDAQVGLSNARLSYTQALYDYKVAQANLEKAMGAR